MRTNGCFTNASPITEPRPTSTLNKPLGKPASSKIFANSSAIKEVTSAGFKMTALPPANAGANFCTSLAIGEFHGVIAATTPTGSCTLMVIKSGARYVFNSSFKVSHAAAT